MRDAPAARKNDNHSCCIDPVLYIKTSPMKEKAPNRRADSLTPIFVLSGMQGHKSIVTRQTQMETQHRGTIKIIV